MSSPDHGPPGDQHDGPEGAPRSAAARLFDIRLMIGILFIVYGVMLTVAGFVASSSAKAKADGININLWLGLSMFVLGLLFLLWQRLSPLRPPPAEEVGAPDEARPHS